MKSLQRKIDQVLGDHRLNTCEDLRLKESMCIN
jgi:hypothetical protein